MIYVLYGTDTAKSRKKLSTLINTLLTKKPDAMLIRTDGESFTESFIGEYAESQGLFEQKSIIVLDQVLENKTHQSSVLDSLELLQSSDNVFIFLEGKLDAKTVKKLSKHAAKIQECELPKAQKEHTSFNIFELSDALGMRNRKKLWVIYQEGKMRNVSSEEMHGILFWGTKNMLLSKEAKSAKEAGLSPFVYKKALGYAKNYSNDELEELSTTLVSLYHEARMGKVPFDIGLETLILEQD